MHRRASRWHTSRPGQGPGPAASGDYAHVRAYTLNPRVLPWVTPICLIAVFVLLFFTWMGMYPSGIQVVSQNGWQTAFGGYADDSNDGKIWQDQNKDDMEYLKTLGSAFFLILFLLLLLPAMVLSLATVLVQRGLIPVAVPPALESVWSLRGLLIAALSVGALVLLVLQLASGFPLESASWKQAEAATTKNGKTYADTEDGKTRRKLDDGKEYGKFNLQRTNMVSLVIFLMVVASITAVLDWWVERRGTAMPPPRLDICY